MSTPLLNKKHFLVCGVVLIDEANRGRRVRQSSALSAGLCRALGVNPFGDSEDGIVENAVTNLMNDLAFVNAEANAAAAQSNHKPIRIPRFAIKGDWILSRIALLKFLRCINCNCDGARASDEVGKAAFGKLKVIIETLTEHIITSTEEWNDVGWFIE